MRSGTTLLRHMLGSHSQLFIPNESHFIPYLARHFEETGRFPLEWLFESDAEILQYPSPADYEARPPEDEARIFGEQLRFVPWAYQLNRERLEDFLQSGSRSYREIVDWIFHCALSSDLFVGDSQSPGFFGDKTPHYVREIPTLRRLYPEALILSTRRDGRAVLCSKSTKKRLVLPETERATRLQGEIKALYPGLKLETVVLSYSDGSWLDTQHPYMLGLPPVLETETRHRLECLVEELRDAWKDYAVETDIQPCHIQHQAEVWMHDMTCGEDADLQVEYRDLVTNPRAELQRICAALGLTLEPQMEEYYRHPNLPLAYGDSFGRFPGNSDVMAPPKVENIRKWQRLLPASAISEFEDVAGTTLRRWGYL